MVWPFPTDMVQKRVALLLPAALDGNRSYIHTFLSSYRNFATPQQVLDLLFLRYGIILSDCHGDGGPLEQLKCAMSTIVNIWLEFHSIDFHEPPEFRCLKFLLAYVHINLPGSEVEHKANLLLAQLEHLEPSEAETEVPASAQAEQLSQELMTSSAPAPAPPPLPEPEREQEPEPKPEPEPEPVHEQDPEPEEEQKQDQEQDPGPEPREDPEPEPEEEPEQAHLTTPETSKEVEETAAPREALAPELPQTPSPVPTPELSFPFPATVLVLVFVFVLHLLKFYLFASFISLV
ncbi:PREDICTED: ral guanine nucleotide dissociation stimulator-like [Galeopterus variegatus]|uniref:Ral guanine nucleotide dissociation stimulator-like n=1 Tax=Galeopterus variegatus TaxID=482537 RepID=A0ABM0RK39_GALVR|nr:PREDICTED: ral guanine nucleotide dissociation stimulator-like [Galeopterus variegatus]